MSNSHYITAFIADIYHLFFYQMTLIEQLAVIAGGALFAWVVDKLLPPFSLPKCQDLGGATC